jgi:hypothetical protein
MPTNGYDPSSQTVFSPRPSSLTHPYSMVNGHIVSSRTPALRAASAEPSAVRPGGLLDSRDSFSETTGVVGDTPVDGERPAMRGWQDKGALGRAPKGMSQPAPGTKDERRSVSDTGSPRSPDAIDNLRRSARMTLWVKPGVKSALQHLADDDDISLSETAATGLEVYARAKIHDQEEALFEPRMQAMMRREIRASDNRHVPFEIKNAIAAEQTRILTADLYKRMLLKEGVTIKEINKKLDAAYNLARTNVLNTKTPKFKNLLREWWQTTDEHAEGRGEARTPKGEAGTG